MARFVRDAFPRREAWPRLRRALVTGPLRDLLNGPFSAAPPATVPTNPPSTAPTGPPITAPTAAPVVPPTIFLLKRICKPRLEARALDFDFVAIYNCITIDCIARYYPVGLRPTASNITINRRGGCDQHQARTGSEIWRIPRRRHQQQPHRPLHEPQDDVAALAMTRESIV